MGIITLHACSIWRCNTSTLGNKAGFVRLLQGVGVGGGCAPSRTKCRSFSIYRTLAKKGPWAVHLTLDLDWGGGPIFEIPLSQLDTKERPDKYNVMFII